MKIDDGDIGAFVKENGLVGNTVYQLYDYAFVVYTSDGDLLGMFVKEGDEWVKASKAGLEPPKGWKGPIMKVVFGPPINEEE